MARRPSKPDISRFVKDGVGLHKSRRNRCGRHQLVLNDGGSHFGGVQSEFQQGRPELSRWVDMFFDIDGHRLGPFEVLQCAVESEQIVALKLRNVPESWGGRKGRTPTAADVCGDD